MPFGYYAVNDRGTYGKAGANIISLYVQDQWQIARPAHAEHRSPHRDPRRFLRSGRKSRRTRSSSGSARRSRRASAFSYDLIGNGRAKLYGSYGRYYDWTKYELPRGSFGGDIWCINYRAIDNPNDSDQRRT